MDLAVEPQRSAADGDPTGDAAGLRLRGVDAGALRGVDLEVAPGEVVGLSGPSGAGKSVLLRAIADLDPHGGEIFLGALRQSGTPAHRWRASVMLVPAESAWWADTVAEHFPSGAADGLEALGLDPRAGGWQVNRLSSGERQRLGLLRALARRPRALLLDEPSANLDPEATRRVEAHLLEVVRQWALPVLWVSHDAAQLGRVARRRLEIRDGRIVEAACN